ncbi:MAG: sugar transporter ATP-binding protein [Proteobacteria bacterium]|nr:sugar transporter ATP-binding protein [Pseudomonadota bacterium]
MAAALEMRGVSKRYPGVVALDNVDLTVSHGEIHAIVGENGAGKSTLMRILSGATTMDQGNIRIDDVAVEIGSSQRAIDLGIGTVYQNLNLVTDLTVAENIYMNRFPMRGGFIDRQKIADGARRALSEMNSDIAPSMRVGDLSVADQQMIAIARVLAYDIKILILDEPTSSLSKAESDDLFRNMRRLKSRGVSIIFISHHMDEIFSVADTVTVLRDGRLIGRWRTNELDEHALVHHMVGREVTEMFPKEVVPIGDVVLSANHISVDGMVHDVSFCVRKGEVLGIGGLVGAGRTELVKSVFGACPGRSGDICLDGQPVDIRSPKQAVEAGIAFVPEDRRYEGLITEFSIEDNIGLGSIWELTRRFVVDAKARTKLSDDMIQTMNVKTPSGKQLVKNLSGGNQQKVVLGKWFARQPKVIIFDEPTRGIDVGAKAEIYRKIGELAKVGVAVIIVSSELPELMGISDRIIVLNKGRMTGEFARAAFSADRIMLAATGKAGLDATSPRGQQQ